MKKVAVLVADEHISAHNHFKKHLTTSGNDVWGDTQLILNPDFGEFEGIICLQSVRPLSRTYTLQCSPSRTLLVIKEPPNILFLPENYTRQFYCSLGQDKRVKSKVPLLSHSGHHWFIGVNIADALGIFDPPKEKLISAVVSNKTHTAGHRKRLEFIRELKDYFGEKLDWFGRGINELKDDKDKAILGYKYHIVLENGAWPHYWTEKLADAFVGNCFPFYWGAPNILDYFDSSSLRKIDIYNARGSIQIIEEAISKNLFETSQDKILSARRKILLDYHPYTIYLGILNKLPPSRSEAMTIKPHNQFRYDLSTEWQMRIEKHLNHLKDFSF